MRTTYKDEAWLINRRQALITTTADCQRELPERSQRGWEGRNRTWDGAGGKGKGKEEWEGKGGEGLQPPTLIPAAATADSDPHFVNPGSAPVHWYT